MKNTINTLLLVLATMVFNASSFVSAESLRAAGVSQLEDVDQGKLEDRNLQAYTGATVYEHWDFQGAQLPLAPGPFSYQRILSSALGNDRASSFRVYDGFTLIACVDDFQWCYSYKHDVSRLYFLNDKFSSFVLIED